MTIPKIYLETTMFSFYYEIREEPHYQEYKTQARQVFDMIRAGKFEPYSSPYATAEIEGEKDPVKREQMKGLVKEYGITILERTEEVEQLAALYIQEKAISPEWLADAAHIAITVINGLDFIVSLNFTHIARPWTIEIVRRVNARENYKGIGIYKPVEVLEL
ncbi:PIN domain-containing protein [Breznakiellaceae bacterium SP9]